MIMNRAFQDICCQATGASSLFKIEEIQSLWSGYGSIIRYGLKGCDQASVIIKHVKLPDQANHPRGWGSDLAHQRKIRSYQVEMAWYRKWAQYCGEGSRVPHSFALESSDGQFLMVLEDLDASGFPLRIQSASMANMQACLKWLAAFHATFMGRLPADLWPVGTYWHLETRPDELNALTDIALKQVAPLVDKKLSASAYQTFVHGDAKLANFCFSANGERVAAVDFQYVGGGCGMKDVAYFIGSCLNEVDCERHEKELLDYYFIQLKEALGHANSTIDFADLEQDWRALYPVAWTDFHRFVKGWSPGHWKIHSYSERLAHDVIAQMKPA